MPERVSGPLPWKPARDGGVQRVVSQDADRRGAVSIGLKPMAAQLGVRVGLTSKS